LLQIARNVGFTLVQDTAALKMNAAILASLGIVMGTTHVAAESVKQASQANSPTLEYVEEQSASNYFRNWGGLTLGYGVIRTFDVALKQGLHALFGAKTIRQGSTSLMQGVQQALGVLLGKVPAITPHPPVFTGRVLVETAEQGFRFQPVLKALGSVLTPVAQQNQLLSQLGEQATSKAIATAAIGTP
jgi:hypothetical protein